MTEVKITRRQNEVLDFIKSYIARRGYAPSRVDIAEHFDFGSANAAQDHILALHDRGAIEVTKGVSRGIKVLNEVQICVI